MEGRGRLRCSARLAGGGAAGPGPEPGARRAPDEAAAAAAALRRQRAAARAAEVEDSPRELRAKCRRLARALRNAKHLVVYTGAGISTAADIPDYRGPRGVWTRLQRGESVGRVEVSRATPTFTHMALTALWARGALKFVVSQNCDGLHLRAGLPRRALAELHGDMFAELCQPCRRVYLRAFDTTERTARHAHGTRRLCHACGAELRDSIVHFGERGRAAWPLNWAGALRHAARADVVLCLGSSLKVLRRYPRLWRMQAAPRDRPALYIVNLQWTPKDSVAALKINARCDAVMRQLARRLRLRVPRYRPRADPLLAHAEPLAPPEAHTTRRPLLRLPEPAPRPAPAPAPPPQPPPPASDSDEELPLRRLAERLRAPAPLCAFQVSMRSGDATILLRAEHAPGTPPPERRAPSELRRFRRAPAPPAPPPAPPPLKAEDVKDEKMVAPDEWFFGSELRRLLELKPKLELSLAGAAADEESSSSSSSSSGASAGSLAAACFARAVLLCRASLYPGLHTILAPPASGAAPPPAPADCAWCLRRFASRRCLWYGAPRCPPLEARAHRRRQGRRWLCACCGDDAAPPPHSAPAPAPAGALDDGGWYGKGYRKGRRRRR